MDKQILDNNIQSLTEKFRNGNVSVFCGAGISFNSGLPLANTLLQTILLSLGINPIQQQIILNSGLPFESFIQTLADETDVTPLLDLFSLGKPNLNHEFLAELIKAGLIKTVLTTNFDLLLEKALENLGLEKDIDFSIFTTEKEFGAIDWDKKTHCRIIKIHGCVSNQDEMAITLGKVAKRTITQNKKSIIDMFFSKSVNENILVLGYSCSDIFDISPQIESISMERAEIIFVDHSLDKKVCFSEFISKKIANNPFSKFSGVRIKANTDTLIEFLWEQFVPRVQLFVRKIRVLISR
ncbi:MAG TPA: SIR2 family protein [Bacteroidia bacterium]|nr:SIR2 family protein [Bacteroidia bacterium]